MLAFIYADSRARPDRVSLALRALPPLGTASSGHRFKVSIERHGSSGTGNLARFFRDLGPVGLFAGYSRGRRYRYGVETACVVR